MNAPDRLAYNRRRNRRIRNGTWERSVDIITIRAHLDTLTSAGMTSVGIAAAANLPVRTVYDVRLNKRRRYVEGHTAAALLAVTPQPTLPPGHVDPTGSARRIQSLTAAGYTLTYQANYLDAPHAEVWRWAHGRRTSIPAARAAAVRDMFDDLSTTPGPSAVACRYAQRHGWRQLRVLDDAVVDDPAADPYTPSADVVDDVDPVAVERALSTRGDRAAVAAMSTAELAATIERGLTQGWQQAPLARHLGVSEWTVKTAARKRQQAVSVS